MTFGDLIDEIAAQAGDKSSAGRTQARRWLNLTRAHIADRGDWRTAFVADASFTTSSATTDGLYSLTGYEQVSGEYLFDETSQRPIGCEGFDQLNGIDPNKEVTGPPDYWADAGVDSSNVRQVYLWPVPDSEYTIRYAAYKNMTDISENNETLTVDPYFGAIIPWQSVFLLGMRYYMDLDNNESAQQIALSLQTLERMIKVRKVNNTVAPHAGLSAGVTRRAVTSTTGRFDPSHYHNRG